MKHIDTALRLSAFLAAALTTQAAVAQPIELGTVRLTVIEGRDDVVEFTLHKRIPVTRTVEIEESYIVVIDGVEQVRTRTIQHERIELVEAEPVTVKACACRLTNLAGEEQPLSILGKPRTVIVLISNKRLPKGAKKLLKPDTLILRVSSQEPLPC